MPLRIATIGRNGQVAQALAAATAGDDAIVLVQAGSGDADLRDAASLARFVDVARPDVLINTGAYNFVDRAETERDAAFAINRDGPRALARLARERGIPFVHMSTDCVFDGEKADAYAEDDAPNPLSAYGHSKLAGERAVADENPGAVTVRVCWVFSEHGTNFVSKMIDLARKGETVRMVDDQFGTPTYGPDVARALLALAVRNRDPAARISGLLHVAAPGGMDRASMARAIFAESARQGGPAVAVEPISTDAFATPARRPLNARLSGARATALLGLDWTPWHNALQRTVRGVLARA